MRLTQGQASIINQICAPISEADAEVSGGRLFSVPAVAGSGKSMMIVEMARRDAQRNMLFLCYSTSIADRARTTLPANITAYTFSEAARHFLQATRPRKAKEHLVRQHTPESLISLMDTGVTAVEAQRAIAVLARFYRSAHPHPQEAHLPLKEDWTHMPRDSKAVLDIARTCWYAQMRLVENGGLPLSTEALIKWWALSHSESVYHAGLGRQAIISPIPDKYDLIIVEEAQLLSVGMLDFMSRQRASIVFFGDGYQALQRGSVKLQHQRHPMYERAETITLHESFRFGPSVASICSALAHKGGAGRRDWVQGASQSAIYGIERRSVWEQKEQPYIFIAAHYVTLFQEALDATRRGKVVAWLNGLASHPIVLLRDFVVLGMGREEAYRAKAARHLIQTPALREVPSLTTFLERQRSRPDSLATQLAHWVYHLDEPYLLRTIDNWIKADNARQAHFSRQLNAPMPRDITLGTVLKAQGHEWPRVALADDLFPMSLCGHDWAARSQAVNMAYTAASRAQRGLALPSMFLAHLKAHGWDIPDNSPDVELDLDDGKTSNRGAQHAYFGADRYARLELTSKTRKTLRHTPETRPASGRQSGQNRIREQMMEGARRANSEGTVLPHATPGTRAVATIPSGHNQTKERLMHDAAGMGKSGIAGLRAALHGE